MNPAPRRPYRSCSLPRRVQRPRAGAPLVFFASLGLSSVLPALSGASRAQGDEKPTGPGTTSVAEPESTVAPVLPARSYIQYGVAFVSEAVASAGPVCGNQSEPCILGSGGGIRVGVGWRPTENLYLGGAYEFSKQDADKLFRLPILQQARCDFRYYFHTGKSVQPFLLAAAGVAGYGNEWGVSTWGPMASLGGGLEVEFSRGAVVDLTLVYRPIYLQAFTDSTPAYHDAGVAHLISFEAALEAQDPL